MDRGIYFYLIFNYAESEKCFEKALTLNPNNKKNKNLILYYKGLTLYN
jgi:tetratricopeptide (TPR) repeat protein